MKNSNKFIPVCQPLFLGDEVSYVQEAVNSTHVSSGPFVEEFEKRFSRYCGARHGISVTSGTTALHLALRSLDIGPGDEVIVPDFAMGAVLFAVLYCGAKPVMVDVERDTWNINPQAVASKISHKTKAIIAVHTYGHPCDMDALTKLAKKNNLKVVEDAAEAHGATYRGQRVGSLADVATFSFYANKIITTGEGGMVLTNNAGISRRCRLLRNLCFSPKGPRHFNHEGLGFNYRFTNLQAALGLAQLKDIEKRVRLKRAVAERYLDELGQISSILCPTEKDYAKNVFWMFGIVLKSAGSNKIRDKICRNLLSLGIETRPFFYPLRLQKALPEKYRPARSQKFPASDFLSQNGFYLPSSPGLSRVEQHRVCEGLKRVLKDFNLNPANTRIARIVN